MDVPDILDLDEFIPSRLAVDHVSADVARRLQVLPIAFNEDESELTLARSGEPSLPIMDSMRRSVTDSIQIKWIQVDSGLLSNSIDKCYCEQQDLSQLIRQCWSSDTQTISIPEVVDTVLCQAVESRASDIHLSATDNAIEFRFRIDGVLSVCGALPRRFLDSMTVRIKVMAELDIAESRRPQDGQFRRLINGSFVECRVSTFPTCRGENIVMRLLRQGQRHRALSELEFPDDLTEKLQSLLHRPSGMVIVCGPTGSGKSSTLFSLLGERDIATLNVMSLEDPVEICIPGICQSNVANDRGMDFASGIRALLRQDPDVLLIGEMRDAESAAMAFRAAMTGHQVLTTVHATDAFSTIDRLQELGVSANTLSSTVQGIVAQRLLRKRCKCPDDGTACLRCNGTGYYGRQAIAEVLSFTPSIRQCINSQGSILELGACAANEGFVNLRERACYLLRSGLTTSTEIDRVLGSENCCS